VSETISSANSVPPCSQVSRDVDVLRSSIAIFHVPIDEIPGLREIPVSDAVPFPDRATSVTFTSSSRSISFNLLMCR